MNKYLINYDLCSPGRNYDSLYEAIRSYDWAQICESCWAVKTLDGASQVRDKLKQCTDKKDRLFVCTLDGWASFGLPKDVTDWLKN